LSGSVLDKVRFDKFGSHIFSLRGLDKGTIIVNIISSLFSHGEAIFFSANYSGSLPENVIYWYHPKNAGSRSDAYEKIKIHIQERYPVQNAVRQAS